MNEAENGGAFYGIYSNIVMENTSFIENIAKFGGAIRLINCTSTFY